MKNRGCLILFMLLLASKSSAQTAAVEVDFYDYAGLQPSTLQKIVNDTQVILRTAYIPANVRSCERPIAVSCQSQSDAKHLLVRVFAGAAKKGNDARHAPLGQSFADHNGGTYASLFLERAKDEAAEANVPWTTVLPYAAAHEIGHLLLGDQAHTPRGLILGGHPKLIG